MNTLTPLEQKRGDARRYAGVTYDRRIDRFTAAITIDGVKKHLGSFLTAKEAGDAYAQMRSANPVRRPLPLVQSIRQLMVEFNRTAARDGDRVAAGEIFTAPDGQRFRVEGIERYKKRYWYVWSARCRVCGDLFTQYCGMKLEVISGLTRNCKAHHGVNSRRMDVWPDPESWGTEPPRIGSNLPRRADASTERAHEQHLESIWQQIKGDKELEQEFYHLENEVMRKFFETYDCEHPDANRYAKYGAWLDQPVDPFKALLEKKQNADALFVTSVPNARREDLEILASEPPSDNSDLV